MTDPVQHAFMRALLDTPGVTQQAVGRRIGIDRSIVSRWLKGDRRLSICDALHLVERWGPAPLVEAGRVVGLEVAVDESGDGPAFEGDTGELRIELLAGLAGEAARLASELVQPPAGAEARTALVRRLRALEELCRKAQTHLLRPS